MGYYVQIVYSDFTIKKEDFDRGFQIVCDLNSRDDLKGGGKFGCTPRPKPAGSKSCASSPDKWFSWMLWNYDEVCDSLPEVLEELGFGIDYNDDGDIVGLSYHSKTGDEGRPAMRAFSLMRSVRSSRRIPTSFGRERTTNDGSLGSRQHTQWPGRRLVPARLSRQHQMKGLSK